MERLERHALSRLLAGLLLLAMVTAQAAAEPIKAIWIWENDTFRLLDDAGWREQVLDRLADDGFNTLYVYADSFEGRAPIVDEPERYAMLIAAARDKGFRVEALLGSAYLETNRYVMPEYSEDARAMLQRVLDYNAAAPENGRFDAIQLDIEPYTLDEWDEDRMQVSEWFAAAAARWRAQVGNLILGAAIPFWFERVEYGEGTLAESLQLTFDYVALMDYRDEAGGNDGIIRHAGDEVILASKLGRKVIIGVETDTADLDKLTFFEEGRLAMESALEEVHEAYAAEPGFGGIAIHHLRSYLPLRD
ncbi:MAG: hypothetical protein R3200_08100 [Xanthomonadales bacterium]|nr:hypothetical protein [Xanthomonadales bacterium]